MGVRTRFVLSDVEDQLGQIERRVEALGEARVRLDVPAVADRWSIVQCIAHLNLTTDAFLPGWRGAAAMEAVEPRTDSNPYGWMHRMMLRTMEPPYGFKTKTASGFRPPETSDWLKTLDLFRGRQKMATTAAREACRFDLDRSRVQYPFASWLRYPLGFSFDLFTAHQRRHVWQAERIAGKVRQARARDGAG